jgi:hypothetical protein
MSIGIRNIQSKVYDNNVLKVVHLATSLGFVLNRLVCWIYLGEQGEMKET